MLNFLIRQSVILCTFFIFSGFAFASEYEISRNEWNRYMQFPVFKEADSELNKTYKALMKQLPAVEKSKLQQEQKIWVDARERNAYELHPKGETAYIQFLVNWAHQRTANLRAKYRPAQSGSALLWAGEYSAWTSDGSFYATVGITPKTDLLYTVRAEALIGFGGGAKMCDIVGDFILHNGVLEGRIEESQISVTRFNADQIELYGQTGDFCPAGYSLNNTTFARAEKADLYHSSSKKRILAIRKEEDDKYDARLGAVNDEAQAYNNRETEVVKTLPREVEKRTQALKNQMESCDLTDSQLELKLFPVGTIKDLIGILDGAVSAYSKGKYVVIKQTKIDPLTDEQNERVFALSEDALDKKISLCTEISETPYIFSLREMSSCLTRVRKKGYFGIDRIRVNNVELSTATATDMYLELVLTLRRHNGGSIFWESP